MTTLTTVGNAEFVPPTNIGKIFTIIYIFAGTGLTFSVAGRIAVGIYLSKQRDN
ncbi:ion channel [Bacillus sp. OV322]|uniref:ion channel n=1 Tax=Bacillus sp. OV322 TaxID=1882764 RepID=UPI00210C2868|nr:ion channel [Bacillus sp. OV322]